MKEIDFLRDRVQRLRHVRWFNTLPCLIPISVAEHSYITAVIVMLMKRAENTPDLLKAALLHDIEEGFTGDLNALAKKIDSDMTRAWRTLKIRTMANVVLKGISPEYNLHYYWSKAQDDILVKAADIVSMWLYCMEETDLGNTAIRYVCYVAENWLRKMVEEADWLQPWVDAIATENTFRGISEEDVPPELRFALSNPQQYDP